MENFKNLLRKRLLNIVVLIAVLLGLFGIPQPVSAAAIVVNTFADEFGTNPGACSLREAIYTANNDEPFDGCLFPVGGADTIVLGEGTYVLSIGTTNEVADAADDIGAMGDLDILSPMQIVGAGESKTIIRPVDGSKTRIIHIAVLNANVIIQDVTLTNGYAYWNNPNSAEPTYEELGGGIFNEYGRLIVWRSTVVVNKAHHSGGGIYSNRESRNSLYILDTTIRQNTAEMGDGGGIVTESAMVITKSLVWKNIARDGSGGGIYNNSAGGRLSAVTVAENEVRTANGRGSGIFADTSIEILNSTIVRNISYARNRYGIEISAGEGVLMNNIIAFNRSFTDGTYAPANCWFTTTVMGTYNFRDVDEKDGSGAAICRGTGADFIRTSSSINLSETLEYNQGLTKNYTLLPNSALIDGGQPQNIFYNTRTGYRYVCSGSDQRWGQLPNDGDGNGTWICDVGAVEYPHPTNGIYSLKKLYLPSIIR